MRADEFSFTVTPTKILTAEEQVEIFQYLCVDPSARKNLPPSSFKTTPRRSKKCLELDSEDEEDTESENSDGLTANTGKITTGYDKLSTRRSMLMPSHCNF